MEATPRREVLLPCLLQLVASGQGKGIWLHSTDVNQTMHAVQIFAQLFCGCEHAQFFQCPLARNVSAQANSASQDSWTSHSTSHLPSSHPSWSGRHDVRQVGRFIAVFAVTTVTYGQGMTRHLRKSEQHHLYLFVSCLCTVCSCGCILSAGTCLNHAA